MTFFPRGLLEGATLELAGEGGGSAGTLAGGQGVSVESGRTLRRDGLAVLIPSADGVAIIHLSASPAATPRRAAVAAGELTAGNARRP